MKIDILKLREGPITVDVRLDPRHLGEGSEEGVFFEPGVGEVTFRMVGNDILAAGKLHSAVHGPCGRCLHEARIPLEADVHLYYWPKREDTGSKIADIDPEEPDFGEYEGDSIDPSEDFREILLVEVPPFLICSEDCKGLCPRCGANLNTEACQCAPGEGDDGKDKSGEAPKSNAWAAQLRSLRLPPKGSGK